MKHVGLTALAQSLLDAIENNKAVADELIQWEFSEDPLRIDSESKTRYQDCTFKFRLGYVGKKQYCNFCHQYTETINKTDCVNCRLSKTNGNLDEKSTS